MRVIDGELELEADTTVDQARFGMSKHPLRNVRPPTKVHVKARLVRVDSPFCSPRRPWRQRPPTAWQGFGSEACECLVDEVVRTKGGQNG